MRNALLAALLAVSAATAGGKFDAKPKAPAWPGDRHRFTGAAGYVHKATAKRGKTLRIPRKAKGTVWRKTRVLSPFYLTGYARLWITYRGGAGDLRVHFIYHGHAHSVHASLAT